MTPEKRLEMHNDMLRGLVEKRRLILTVEVHNTEQAEELIEWMYAPTKPMKSDLLQLAWDRETVSRREYEALQQFKAALVDC